MSDIDNKVYSLIDEEIKTSFEIYNRTIALGKVSKIFLQQFKDNDIEIVGDVNSYTENGKTYLFISIIFKNKKMFNMWFRCLSLKDKILLEWKMFHHNDLYEENTISEGDIFIDSKVQSDNIYDEDNINLIKEYLNIPTVDLFNLGYQS